jgi:hypothetical protein
MPTPPATFSESWHRVANQPVSLRPGIRVRRQNFRGRRWHLLENPFSNQFFRLQPAALLHGRSGKIRFDLDPEPLLPRWIRRVRQLLQQRYQV